MSVALGADAAGDEVLTSQFPLHRACRDGDVGALASLLQRLSNQATLVAEDSCYGWTPLHWAAHYGQLECVMHLVQMGCDVNTVTSRFSQTPTHTAAFGGHAHCLVWLTQAGANVNQQDLVGEAPIHKAARSGSLECIQVLLIAGAKPHLRNASGQTAADLAHAGGSHDCSRFIHDAQTHLLQLELHANGAQRANGAPCGQGLLSRKRLLVAVENGHLKKARRDVTVGHSDMEEPDSMNVESAQELSPELKAGALGSPNPPSNQEIPPTRGFAAAERASPQRRSADMCGSLHLSGSPGSCGSHRPAWWARVGLDHDDSLHYGHYHGFGDTAEELTESSSLLEQSYTQGVASSVHLYQGS